MTRETWGGKTSRRCQEEAQTSTQTEARVCVINKESWPKASFKNDLSHSSETYHFLITSLYESTHFEPWWARARFLNVSHPSETYHFLWLIFMISIISSLGESGLDFQIWATPPKPIISLLLLFMNLLISSLGEPGPDRAMLLKYEPSERKFYN